MNANLKKAIRSKKTKLVLTGAALLTMGLGTTYAWWTASSETSNTVSMGTLDVKAAFDGLEDVTDYEPGLDVEGNGVIENKSTMIAYVKVSSDSTIKFADKTEEEAIDPKAIQTTFTPVIDENDSDVYWFNDPAGNLYAMMNPGAAAKVSVTENFTGDTVGNEYMGAVVTTKIKTDSTQALPGAVQAEFNFDMGTAIDYPTKNASNPDPSAGPAYKTNDYHTRAMKALHDAMNREKA